MRPKYLTEVENIGKDEIHALFHYENGELYWKPRLNNISWTKRYAGKLVTRNKTTRNGYERVHITAKKRSFAKHRLIWIMHNGAIPVGMQVDHINNVPNDNRIENLQLLNNSENNQKKYASSKRK